jgi:hypothetical protein
MVTRDEAVAIALKLAADDPPSPRAVESIGDVFTMDGGQTWTVHLVPVPHDAGDGAVWFDTPGVWAVCVNGATGSAKWYDSL